MAEKKIMRFITPALQLSDNLAIIGSSDCLLNNKFGSEIDSFDEVVRFNRAPVDGYETIVGSKTTIRLLNGHVALNMPFKEEELAGGFWGGQRLDFNKSVFGTNILVYMSNDISPEHTKIITQTWHSSNTIFHFTHSPHTEACPCPCGIEKGRLLSVGTFFVSLCIASNIVPHLFGFDLDNRARGHYWERRPPTSECHDISSEKKILIKLLEEERIIVHK